MRVAVVRLVLSLEFKAWLLSPETGTRRAQHIYRRVRKMAEASKHAIGHVRANERSGSYS
jgi:hypothetical protein